MKYNKLIFSFASTALIVIMNNPAISAQTQTFRDITGQFCAYATVPWYWESDPCTCHNDPTAGGTFPGRTENQCKKVCARPEQWKFNENACLPFMNIGGSDPGNAQSLAYGGNQLHDIYFHPEKDAGGFSDPNANPCPPSVSQEDQGITDRYYQCTRDFARGSFLTDIADYFGDDTSTGLVTTKNCTNGVFMGAGQGTEGCPWYSEVEITATIVPSPQILDETVDKTFVGVCQKFENSSAGTLDIVPPGVDSKGKPTGSYVDKNAVFNCELMCVYDAPSHETCPDGAPSC